MSKTLYLCFWPKSKEMFIEDIGMISAKDIEGFRNDPQVCHHIPIPFDGEAADFIKYAEGMPGFFKAMDAIVRACFEAGHDPTKIVAPSWKAGDPI